MHTYFVGMLNVNALEGIRAGKGDERKRTLSVWFLGFGAVGQRVAELLLAGSFLRLGRDVKVLAVSDSKGGTKAHGNDGNTGLDLAALLVHKRLGNSVTTFAQGQPFNTVDEFQSVLTGMGVDIVVDMSPVDLKTGGPNMPILFEALESGCDLVLANKAPLVLKFHELHNIVRKEATDLESIRTPKICFSATVCGGLPVVNVGCRDLAGATFLKISGIFNSTTNYILTAMESGRDRDEALREAQKAGIAEADPSLDIEGYDTANKLVIIANAILGIRATLDDVDVQGIQNVTRASIAAAASQGKRIRLVASAVRRNADTDTATPTTNTATSSSSSYDLKVAPESVDQHSFLASCDGSSMCCTFTTDVFETVKMQTDEKGVYPTSSAVLRDIRTIVFPC